MTAEPITEDYLRQLRLLLEDGVSSFSNQAVASLVAKVDKYRTRLVAAEADLLNVRGTLSPNGQPRRVPVELVPAVAPAVEWLANERDRLLAVIDRVCEHKFALPDETAEEPQPGDCLRCGMTYQQYDSRFGERMAEALEGGA